jgi:hypothetical protein
LVLGVFYSIHDTIQPQQQETGLLTYYPGVGAAARGNQEGNGMCATFKIAMKMEAASFPEMSVNIYRAT